VASPLSHVFYAELACAALPRQVVVFHDEDLERMTGVSAKIIDLCYHELPPIRHDPVLIQQSFRTEDTNACI
jgi:hypothetical protein